MTNIKEELEQLKEKITELESKIAQEAKKDFSQWIERDEQSLAIRWDKYLISYAGLSIVYAEEGYNYDKANFNDDITYRKWKLKDLKYWDIFIVQDDLDDIELYNFNIFIWKDKDWDYVAQYLIKDYWLEAIKSNTYCKRDFEDKDILIFNRF